MKTTGNTGVEENFSGACDGNRKALAAFLEGIVAGPLFVPERYQAAPLSNAPKYPNDLVTFLGVQDRERVVVPAFSAPERIAAWCGNQLSYRTLSGQDLFKLLPEGWWVSLNPGSELEKEFSPWEIRALQSGSERIPEIVEDLLAAGQAQPVALAPIEAAEYPQLLAELRAGCSRHNQIVRAYLLKENSSADEPAELRTPACEKLLLGLELHGAAAETAAAIKAQLYALAQPQLIGAAEIRIQTGDTLENSLWLGIFKGVEPFYVKPGINSWWSRLIKIF